MGFSAHNVTGVWVGNDDNTPMASSKALAVTGGRIPAPAWKRIMDVAEFGVKPEGLPGVPLDDTYTPPPTQVADLSATAATQPDQTIIAPDEESAAAALAAEDSAVADGEPDADSKDILNSMIDLVQPANTQQADRTTHPKRRAAAPLSSMQRRSPGLFDFLFGRVR